MYSYLNHRERGERERKESKGGEFLRERGCFRERRKYLGRDEEFVFQGREE